MVSTMLLLLGLELAEVAAVEGRGRRLDRGQRALELVGDDGHEVQHLRPGRVPPGLEGVGDDAPQLLGREGLRDVVEGPVLQGLAGGLDVGVAGEDDDDEVRLLLPQGLQDLHPAQAGHLQVRDDDVVAPGPGHLQAFVPGRRRVDLVAGPGEDPARALEDDVLVVDEQQLVRHGPLSRRARRHGAGSLMMNSVPFPTWLLTSIVPLCRWMTP